MKDTYRVGNCIAQLMRIRDDRWMLTHIGVPSVSKSRGQGHGERCLTTVTDEADREHITLILVVDPDPDMDYERIRNWYRRHGFVDMPELGSNRAMERAPRLPASAYDRAAAEWLSRRFPHSRPIIGSVSFELDFAAYNSGPRYCEIDVSWQELSYLRRGVVGGVQRYRDKPVIRDRSVTLGGMGDHSGPSGFDLTQLITELTDIACEFYP